MCWYFYFYFYFLFYIIFILINVLSLFLIFNFLSTYFFFSLFNVTHVTIVTLQALNSCKNLFFFYPWIKSVKISHLNYATYENDCFSWTSKINSNLVIDKSKKLNLDIDQFHILHLANKKLVGNLRIFSTLSSSNSSFMIS